LGPIELYKRSGNRERESGAAGDFIACGGEIVPVLEEIYEKSKKFLFL
jgi:hypothetical protein